MSTNSIPDTTKVHTLPVITIDPTFSSVIHDVDAGLVPTERFWVSCYKAQEPSVHAKVDVELDEVDRNLVRFKAVEGDVQFVNGKAGLEYYTVSCRPLDIPPTKVALPIQEYRDSERSNPQRPHRITAFDLAPDSSQFATGFLDGSVFLYPTTPFSHTLPIISTTITPTIRTTSRPHLSTITHLRFFPSSRVLLTAAADFSLAILPAELPTDPAPTDHPIRVNPVRTLRGHTRSITATAIIARGRNVLSTSLDSTMRLWDVPSGTTLSTLPTSSPVLSLSLGDTPTNSSSPTDPTGIPTGGEMDDSPTTAPEPQEIPETAQKTAFVGLQNGVLEQFDLRIKRSVFKSAPSTAGGLSAVAYNYDRNLVVTGSTKGLVRVFDVRRMADVVVEFQRNEAGIEDLVFLDMGTDTGRMRLALATADGLPYVADVGLLGADTGSRGDVKVDVELAGGDCDPVRAIRAWRMREQNSEEGMEVWSAGDDAVVRRYVV